MVTVKSKATPGDSGDSSFSQFYHGVEFLFAWLMVHGVLLVSLLTNVLVILVASLTRKQNKTQRA